jgi:hypothetical protein
MALLLVWLKGINSPTLRASPMRSKNVIRLTSPPNGVTGLEVERTWTYRPAKTGLQKLCIVW